MPLTAFDDDKVLLVAPHIAADVFNSWRGVRRDSKGLFCNRRLTWIDHEGFVDVDASGLGSSAYEPKARPTKFVADRCDRGFDPDFVVPDVPSAGWSDERWESHARMAAARRHAGKSLSFDDVCALQRYPKA